ncbi:MAG: twin arginine-targeting protein translocase TatB [Betaproteobacteria bacterium RIFCSPLOWO2_02_FULL_65_20]|nr:MAG: twin arginine-targeting protein translocase TatB [Betaproteobacteria bacterium RIFCSPLOWO2_02_FULL_65_20]
MFDIGFSELMLVAVVALVVIGPERLPAVARTVGHLFGRLQRYVNDVKADISREIELDELRKFKNQFEEAAQSVESSVRAEVTGAEASLDAIAAEVNSGDSASADLPAAAAALDAPDAMSAAAHAAVPDSASPPAAAPDAAPPVGAERKTAARSG